MNRTILPLLLLALGCTPPVTNTPEESAVASGDSTANVQATVDPVDTAEFTEPEPTACEHMGYYELCIARPECVYDPVGSGCRAVHDECERWWTDRASPAPTECPTGCAMRRDPRSAHNIGLCVAYVQVTECPATPEEALALSVDCGLQAAPFACDYEDSEGELTIGCHLPWAGCGGGAQMPPQQPRWSQLRAPADFDEHGCPQTADAQATRCRAPRSLECISRCGAMTQCIQGRWQVTRVPPPRP